MNPLNIAFSIGKCIVAGGAALICASIARRYAFEGATEILMVATKLYAGDLAAEAAAAAAAAGMAGSGGGEGVAAAA